MVGRSNALRASSRSMVQQTTCPCCVTRTPGRLRDGSPTSGPWELLMATGFIYALPPAAIYYTFKRYMVGGLTAGAVKS